MDRDDNVGLVEDGNSGLYIGHALSISDSDLWTADIGLIIGRDGTLGLPLDRYLPIEWGCGAIHYGFTRYTGDLVRKSAERTSQY